MHDVNLGLALVLRGSLGEGHNDRFLLAFVDSGTVPSEELKTEALLPNLVL